MQRLVFILLFVFSGVIIVKADAYSDMALFAQAICGDIPEGSLSRTTVQGKVRANAGTLAKLIGAAGDTTGAQTEEIYRGIPFEKLPDKIPTISMCKTELVKILLLKSTCVPLCKERKDNCMEEANISVQKCAVKVQSRCINLNSAVGSDRRS